MSRKQPEFVAQQPLRLIDESVLDDYGMDERGSGEGLLHLKDLIPRLLIRWHWIALGLVLGLGLGCYLIWRAVPQYESRASVVVPDNIRTIIGQKAEGDIDPRNAAALETVRSQLQTFELCEAVASDPMVRDLKGLVPPKARYVPFLFGGGDVEREDISDTELTTMILEGWLETKVRRDTRLIDITITHPEPAVSKVVANKIVEHYIKEQNRARTGDQKDSLKFLMAESKRVEKELQQARTTSSSYSVPLEAEKALTVAETAVDTLSLRYGPKHPKMIEARRSLKLSTDRLRTGLLRAINNPVDADYWSAYRASIEDLDTLGALDPFRDRLISRNAMLESEIESQDALYSTLLSQLETVGLITESPEDPVTPAEAARLGEKVGPNKPKILAASLAFGLFGGVGLAFLFQLFDNKFHTVSDVESQLGLPVLSAVASIDPGVMAKEEKKHRGEDNGWVSGREQWAPQLVFRTEGANSHYSEMFRVLRTSISLLGPSDQRKITMITSALPGEGKTLVAANLAVALAQQGVNTLLVDFDLRKPSVHKMFGLSKDGQPGIVNLLVGNQGAGNAVQTLAGQANLSLLLSGPKAPNPGELLEAGRLTKLFNAFREHFDHIVIDSAPLLAVPDSRILAPLADNLGLAVRAESTPRGAVKRALDVLDHSNITPEGIIFNGYVERRSLIGKNYSYGYYRYGRYGHGKYEHDSYGSVYGEEEED